LSKSKVNFSLFHMDFHFCERHWKNMIT